MKKKIFCAFLIFSFLGIICSCNEEKSKTKEKQIDIEEELLSQTKPAPETDFEFELNKDLDGVILRKYKGSSEYLVVPEAIQGIPIVEISPLVDSGTEKKYGNFFMKNVKGILLPSHLKKIGEYAFYQNGITTVEFNSSLETIGSHAFEWCYKIENITLPSSLRNIEREAFKFCGSLKTMELPPLIDSISSSCFEGCKDLGEVTLPNELKYICKAAFKNCHRLSSIKFDRELNETNSEIISEVKKTITLPATLKAIDAEAFYNTGIESIEMPIAVKAIGKDAFGKCDLLAEIRLPENISCVEIDWLIIGKKPYLWYVRPKPSKDFSIFFSGEKISQSLALQKILKEHKTHGINLEMDWLDNYKDVEIYNWNWS